MPPHSFSDIETAVAETGLMVRGGYHLLPQDNVPGNPASLVLIGNAGPGLWQAFEASQAATQEDGADPLDIWTKQVATKLAEKLGARALFPFEGPPYLPFQRWAQRCEPVYPSPIGPLIHPTYGLWHAYRAALVFDEKLDLSPKTDQPSHDQISPCETCADQPCLTTCPVNAFRPDSYNVPACVDFVTSDLGTDCLEQGCAARRGCPVGQDYIYDPAQAAFHMKAFASSQNLAQKS